VSLALFLTAFVMGPALQRAYDTGIRPLVAWSTAGASLRAR
jgi:flagellar biosynthesis protein FliP